MAALSDIWGSANPKMAALMDMSEELRGLPATKVHSCNHRPQTTQSWIGIDDWYLEQK